MRRLSLPFSLASLAALAALFALRPATAETCLSPFVKRLDRPATYPSCFCVDADPGDHHFLAVIDVTTTSSPSLPCYGRSPGHCTPSSARPSSSGEAPSSSSAPGCCLSR